MPLYHAQDNLSIPHPAQGPRAPHSASQKAWILPLPPKLQEAAVSRAWFCVETPPSRDRR